MADEPHNGVLHEARINIEALSSEVNFLKSSQVEDRARFSAFQSEVRESFRQQNAAFSNQFQTLGEKIEKQGRESAASRPKINDLITTGCAVGGFLAILGGALFYPVVTTQGEISRDLKEWRESTVTFRQYEKDEDRHTRETAETTRTYTNWITRVQDNSVTQRQLEELIKRVDGELLNLKNAQSEIISQFVRRPEITAANEAQDKQFASRNADVNDRIKAIVDSLAALRTEFNSISPLSNTIRDLQDRLAHVTQQR